MDKISSQVSWLQEFCDHLVENSLSRSSSAAARSGQAAEARGTGGAKQKREGGAAKRKREKSAGGEGGKGKRSALLRRLANGLEEDDERVGSLSAAVAAADSEELCSAFTQAEGEQSTPLDEGLSREMDLRLLDTEEGKDGLSAPGPSSLQGEQQLGGILRHGRFAAEHDDGGGGGSPSCVLADGSTLMEAISPDALSPNGLMSPTSFGVDVDELLKIVDTSSREQAVLEVLSSPRGVPLITLSAAFDLPADDAGEISGKVSGEVSDESLPLAPPAGKRRLCNGASFDGGAAAASHPATPDHPPSAAAAAAAAAATATATGAPSRPPTVPAAGASSQERQKSARVAAARTSTLPADPSRAPAAGATGASGGGASASAEADGGDGGGWRPAAAQGLRLCLAGSSASAAASPGSSAALGSGIALGSGVALAMGAIGSGDGDGDAQQRWVLADGPGSAFGSAVPELVASPARAPLLAFEPCGPTLLQSPHRPMRMSARSLT